MSALDLKFLSEIEWALHQLHSVVHRLKQNGLQSVFRMRLAIDAAERLGDQALDKVVARIKAIETATGESAAQPVVVHMPKGWADTSRPTCSMCGRPIEGDPEHTINGAVRHGEWPECVAALRLENERLTGCVSELQEERTRLRSGVGDAPAPRSES